jgi:hypothetical protein
VYTKFPMTNGLRISSSTGIHSLQAVDVDRICTVLFCSAEQRIFAKERLICQLLVVGEGEGGGRGAASSMYF